MQFQSRKQMKMKHFFILDIALTKINHIHLLLNITTQYVAEGNIKKNLLNFQNQNTKIIINLFI